MKSSERTFVRESGDGVELQLRVQPKAGRNEVGGFHGDALKVRVTAPPADGAANKAVRKLLSKLLRTPARDIEIVAGVSSRNKRVCVHGLTVADILDRIGSEIP